MTAKVQPHDSEYSVIVKIDSSQKGLGLRRDGGVDYWGHIPNSPTVELLLELSGALKDLALEDQP